MPEANLGAGQAVEEVARRWAARQAESLERYGGLLSRYGSAKLSTRDLGENLYKLAVEESARAFGDAVEFGVGYWRGVFSSVVPAAARGSQAGGSPSRVRKSGAGASRSRK